MSAEHSKYSNAQDGENDTPHLKSEDQTETLVTNLAQHSTTQGDSVQHAQPDSRRLLSLHVETQ